MANQREHDDQAQLDFTNEQRGDDAEHRARQLANAAGLRPSGVTKDVHGFDAYVQVPLESTDGRPESFLTGSIPALIQVKGTIADRVKVDLHVWKTLLEAPTPAFFLIYQYADKTTLTPHRLSLVHLHGELLDAAAKRIWTAEAEGSCSGKTMDVVWGPEDEVAPQTGRTFRRRLQSAIGNASEYVTTKVAARERAGRRERPYTLHVRSTGASRAAVDQELAEFAVGLREELPIDSVHAFEERFGVQRALSGPTNGPVTFAWPDGMPPTEPCRIIFIDNVSGEETPLTAQVAISSRVFPWLSADAMLLRVFHEAVDFVLGSDNLATTFSFHPPEDFTELRQLALAQRVWTLLDSGCCDLELHVAGVRPYRLNFNGKLGSNGLSPAVQDWLSDAAIAHDIARRANLPDDLTIPRRELARLRPSLRRAAIVLKDAAAVSEFNAKAAGVTDGSQVALLFANWLKLGDDLVAVHGILLGPATRDPDGESIRVERPAGRLLLARRLSVPYAVEVGDGLVATAVAQAEAASAHDVLIGVDDAEQGWERVQAHFRKVARDEDA